MIWYGCASETVGWKKCARRSIRFWKSKQLLNEWVVSFCSIGWCLSMLLMRLMIPPQELEACRSRLEILREMNSMFKEEVGGFFLLPFLATFSLPLPNRIHLRRNLPSAGKGHRGSWSQRTWNSISAGHRRPAHSKNGGDEAQEGGRCMKARTFQVMQPKK